jgi:acetyl esterase/lipase
MRRMAVGTIASLIVLFGTDLIAQQYSWPPASERLTLPLWSGATQDAPRNGPAETATASGGRDSVAGKPIIRLANVSEPALTLYTPSGRNTGAAVVVFPGGGYNILAIDLEGTEVCAWLNSAGVNCILVKYRVPGAGPYPKSNAALQDAQRALGLIREHATEWHIDPGRIGVLGFSAGAHLAATLSTHFEQRFYDPVDAADRLSCRPDFTVLVYPAYLVLEDKDFEPNPEIRVTEKSPPAFIVQAEDDPVHVENATTYFLELKRAKVPAELHIYANGGHGYGLRSTDLPITEWPRSAEIWLHTIGVLRSGPQ